MSRHLQNSFRIIGGRWRGRRLEFPADSQIRPSPDRVRETLFNWLRWVLPGARCLDLFAGSGSLGIEALSHGAAAVDFVDRDRVAITAIAGHLEVLGAQAGRTHCTSAERFLEQATEPYDIVFLDPPFAAGLVPGLLAALSVSDRVRAGGWIYVEQAARDGAPVPPAGWALYRSRRAGEVGYHLLQHVAQAPD